MKRLRIVGGDFSDVIKERSMSSVVSKLYGELITTLVQRYGILSSHSVNGGSIKKLKEESRDSITDITVWMPNISNTVEKIYPTKPKGGILICSKVLRKHRTVVSAVGRIFRMHGNAVIAISKDNSNTLSSAVIYRFTLLDALGNVWVDTTEIKKLSEAIADFCVWHTRSKRIGSTSVNLDYNISLAEKLRLKKFCELNSKVADKVERGNKDRYFGNCSTRCALMFPSTRSRNSNYVFVSRRNSDKKRLSASDMLITTMNKDNNSVIYQGAIKPSVDTPIQAQLYKQFPEINYMIHGHAYIDDGPMTDTYHACGDLREINDTAKQIKNKDAGGVNLRNHGFLIYSKTIKAMETYIKQSTFKNKIVGEDFI